MLPIVAAFNPSQILDYVGPIFVVLFFFLLPILKAIKQAREKQREVANQRPRGPAESSGEEVDGRRAWEDLLRGDVPASPPPVAVPMSRPPPIQRVEPVETFDAPAEQPLTGKLSDLSSAPDEDEQESSYDEEKLARDANEGSLRDEMQRRADFLARAKEQAARKTVSTSDMSSTDSAAEELVVARAERSRLVGLLDLDGGRRAALRRAFVAGEVFGTPVGLRRALARDQL